MLLIPKLLHRQCGRAKGTQNEFIFSEPISNPGPHLLIRQDEIPLNHSSSISVQTGEASSTGALEA